MHIAKTAFAILASLLLVGTQAAFAFGQDSSPTSHECGCCSCKQMDCCMAQPTSTPQPIPTSPVRTVTQNNLQIIAAVVSLLLQAPEKSAEPISFPPFSSLHVTAVPLYELNCSYLI
jgi:hypothetical protein